MSQAAYACNGQPISSAGFYAIACDPRRSVAVEACAGAGKTWMLVSRILRALLEPASRADDPAGTAPSVQPQEILAITFTRKAASEMRQRLNEWLEAFAHASDAQLLLELQSRGIAQPSEHQRQQLRNLYRHMLESGRTVQIQTFHGWFAALLRGAPVAVLQQLGLPLQYQLLESDEQARQQVWRPFYALLTSESSPAALKADFETLVQLHGRFNTRKALEAVLSKRTEFLLADAAGVAEASVQPFGVLFPALRAFVQPTDGLATPEARAFWLGIAQSLGSEKNKPPQKAAAAIIAAFEKPDLPERFKALRLAFFVQKENRLNNNLTPYPAADEAAAALLELCQASAQHEAWLHQQRMTRLGRALIAEYASLKRSQGWVDMNDVERAAFTLLSDPLLSGWVQERLDAQIRHLMIDEFQDTNPLQWQALSSWLAGYAGAASRPSVFLVGDPKQSIYRFRRAEPQVFVAAQQFVVDGLGGDLLSCDHTRRNAVAVIGAVNAVMGSIQASSGYAAGFRTHTSASELPGDACWLPQVPRFEKKAKVAQGESGIPAWRDSLLTPRELPEETLRTLEAQQAARWIASQIATNQVKASEVMVLARKRAGLQPLQQALQALRIAAVIGEKTQLIDCCEVQDVVALLDVLVSAPHDLSLARALRSPLFGVPDSALVDLALLQQSQALPWLELLQNPEYAPPALAEVAPKLLRWKAWLDQLPPHDALQRIYDDGDVLARFAAAVPPTQRSSVLANLQALLSVALNMASGGRYATPYALVRLLKSGDAEATQAVALDAVQLLTVHGAKGLEAKAVLLLDTDSQESRTPSMDMLIDWPGEYAHPQRFVFIVSEKNPPLCAAQTLAIEQQARLREESNALYVAMTRARETLAVSSIAPHHANPESWWQRLLTHLPPFALPGTPDAQPLDEAAVADLAFSLSVLPAWQALDAPMVDDAETANPAEIESSDGDGQAAIDTRIGLAMHRLLEWGPPPALQDAKSAAAFAPQQTAAVAREFALDLQQSQRASAMAHTILQGEAAWAWQAEALAWQGNEVALVFQGQMLRIDRLVQRRDAGHAGHWWILDYKSALTPQSQPTLVAQLAHYRQAVQAAYPGALVKAAFLTGNGQVVEP